MRGLVGGRGAAGSRGGGWRGTRIPGGGDQYPGGGCSGAGESDGVSTGATPLVTIKRSRSECPTFLCSVNWGRGRGVQSYTNRLQLGEMKASADSNSDHRSTPELLADLGSSATLCPVLFCDSLSCSATLCPVLRHSVLFCYTLSCSATLCPVL